MMKIAASRQFWLIISQLIVLISINGEFIAIIKHEGQSLNDFNKNLLKEFLCVTDELNSSLTLVDELERKYLTGRESQVLYSDDDVHFVDDKIDCQMSSKDSCSNFWTRSTSWKYVNTSIRPMLSLFDDRYFTDQTISENFQLITNLENPGTQIVSIIGGEDVNFAICCTNEFYRFCFDIIIDRNGLYLNKCETQLLDEYASNDLKYRQCSNILSKKIKLVLPQTWSTYMIKWDYHPTGLKISMHTLDQELLSYNSVLNKEKSINFPESSKIWGTHQLYAKSSSSMRVKFHNYEYLLTKTTQSKLMSPEMMTDHHVCIEMSISLCESCLMTVDFIDRNNKIKVVDTLHQKQSSNTHDLTDWTYFRIERDLSDLQQPIRIKINTLSSNQKLKNHHWAILSIRRCHDAAVKVIKYHANDNSFGCQKISANGASSYMNMKDLKIFNGSYHSDWQPCKKDYIGPTCLVKCSKLFPERDDCRGLLACDERSCLCAPGYHKSSCNESCPSMTYGLDCKQNCGKCAEDNCDFVTGECKNGCTNSEKISYEAPYCKNEVKLSAPKVDVIDSKTVRVYLENNKEFVERNVIITFEIWSNLTTMIYTNTSTQAEKFSNIEAYFNQLLPGTQYYAASTRTYNDSVIPRTLRSVFVNFTTPCAVSSTFELDSNETSILVNPSLINTDSCPYKWYRVQLFKDKKLLFNDSVPFPKLFPNLEPFTRFTVVVSTIDRRIVKSINTTEGAPDAVENPRVLSYDTNKIDVAWEPTLKPRGKIVNYTIEIQPIKSLGCRDSKKSDTCRINGQQAFVTNISHNEYRHTFYGLKPYVTYEIVIYASTAKHRGVVTKIMQSTKPIEIQTEVFDDLRVTYEASEAISGNLRWNRPNDCCSITGPIVAAKLRFDTLNRSFIVQDDYFPLSKSIFYNDETYQVHVYALRSLKTTENGNAYKSMNFTIYGQVRNFEIIEVDTRNNTFTLRWNPPYPALNELSERYAIFFCYQKSVRCYEVLKIFNDHETSCKVWEIYKNSICKTVDIPNEDYDTITMKTYNARLPEGSEPVSVSLEKKEFTPSAPQALSVWISNANKSTANISWTHPSISGGKIVRFEVTARLNDSKLKSKPWKEKIISLDLTVSGYRLRYTMDIDLFPASRFVITIKAVTSADRFGREAKKKINVDRIVNFGSTNLKGRADEDQTIRIVVPKTVYDTRDTKMVIMVEGPRHCGKGSVEDEDVNTIFNTQNSSYYKIHWKAATLTDPGLYENKEFTIGDGQSYGGSINYALCSEKYYVINLLHISDLKNLASSNNTTLNDIILQKFKTNAIYVEKAFSIKYAFWTIPIVFIFLIAIIIAVTAYRRKFVGHYFVRKKQRSIQQENMYLSNGFSKKNKKNEIENSDKVEETQDLLNDHSHMTDGKKTDLTLIKVEDFEDYFENTYKSGVLKNNFAMIKSGPSKSSVYGSKLEVKLKNRYANLFPYDETRVVLEKLPNEPYSDYINANFITGYDGKEKAYIATQGPKLKTINDFWRMIYQEKVQLVCMMVNLVETGKNKCERYWPISVEKKVSYGKITVELLSEKIHSDYTYRTLWIHCKKQESRMIQHLQYTAWPDHGVPSNLRSIVSFLKEIQKYAPISCRVDYSPILVHCSAGIGRTGALIVLDMAICRGIMENVMDVHSDVVSIRNDRLNMVGNAEQYLFIHLVLIEYFDSRDTCLICDKELPASIAEARMNSLKDYRRILKTSWWNEILGSPYPPETPFYGENNIKRRFPELAPCDEKLMPEKLITIDKYNDCVTATLVKKLFQDTKYIATQLPLPSTSSNFWTMLFEEKIEYVLVLQLTDSRDSTFCELKLPESLEILSSKCLRIVKRENSKIDLQYYFEEEICIIDGSTKLEKIQNVKIICYKNWPESSFPSPEDIIKLWKIVEDLPKNYDIPTVVACRDGVSVCGLWLASIYLLKRMTADNECDVSSAVRAIRQCRKDFITNIDQFEYLYDVALTLFNKK